MNTENHRLKAHNVAGFLFFCSILIFGGCQRINLQNTKSAAPKAMRDVPAFAFEFFGLKTDVPAPVIAAPVQTEERNVAVNADFDNNRTQEILDKTLTSPDKQRVLAIFHKAQDSQGDFRIDMYAVDGKILRRVTSEGMAVHYPDTIVWSPDSKSVAMMAKTRAVSGTITPESAPTPAENPANVNLAANTNESIENTNAESNANAAVPVATPVVEAAKPVLTFRTEQIYICDREAADLKPVTQNEGLIYFYFVWSPDGAALAALAATNQEWNYLQYQAELKGELFNPQGRPRLVEKSGRERRLDDNLTLARPVWSPDSAKVAVAFDKQVRIYDAIGDQPTQAAIPLRNQLLISSKAFDENLQRQEQGGNANAPAANQETATLPDESSLVSFNPIVTLEWTADDLLYLQTGYIKQMKNEADSVRSYLRWHRLVFSPQANMTGN